MAINKKYAKPVSGLQGSIDKLLTTINRDIEGQKRDRPKRHRRSKKETVALRRAVRVDRKRGLSAEAIAKKYKVTANYVYLLTR